MEIWDAYDKNGKLLDKKLIRGEEIPEGQYHLVCEALIRHRDGSFLLMQRSENKVPYPNYYEASCGGSALSGEDALSCIKREMLEETGLLGDKFEQLDYHVSKTAILISYVCFVDCDKNSVKLQEGETQSFKWVDRAGFIKHLQSDKCIDTQKNRFLNYFIKEGLANK